MFSIIFLPLVLFIGFITSYEDFMNSRIKNKWIIAGLLYASVVYFLSWIIHSLAIKGIVAPVIREITFYLIWNLDKWCINLAISSIIAYCLWHFKMWGAGDAKLFICYSALIPMGQYSKVYFNYYFASFLLLLVIFIPATVYLFLRSMIYFIKKLKFSKIREEIPELIKEKLIKFNKIEAVKVLLGFFVIFFSFRILREGLQNLIRKILPNQNMLMLISLLAFKPLSKVFKKNAKLMIIVLIILIVYVSFRMVYLKEQFILNMGNIFARAVFIMVLFPVFKRIISLYSESTVRKTIPFAPWMFLGALIIWFIL